VKGFPAYVEYKKILPNIYESVEKEGRRPDTIIFLSGTNLSYTFFKYNTSKKTNDRTIRQYELISPSISEDKPADTKQSTPTADINGKWTYLGTHEFNNYLNSLLDGNILKVTFHGFPNLQFPFKNIAPYTYEYSFSNGSISTIKYLNNTILSIHFAFRNFSTTSYYTRSAQ